MWMQFDVCLLQMRYANNSQYKNDRMIRKECFVNSKILDELRKIIEESEVRPSAHVVGFTVDVHHSR